VAFYTHHCPRPAPRPSPCRGTVHRALLILYPRLLHGHNTLCPLFALQRGISPEMAIRLSRVFGGSLESWHTQQAHYDLARLRTSHIKLKRRQFA
jgi:hypothetical protein